MGVVLQMNRGQSASNRDIGKVLNLCKVFMCIDKMAAAKHKLHSVLRVLTTKRFSAFTLGTLHCVYRLVLWTKVIR